ncbi:MAG: hypothetical protein HW410_1424 [Nitrosarchaeum sp.]|nr:hypothetical protein [Nitrosarchaeum sp.]
MQGLKNYLPIIIAFSLILVNFNSVFAQENFIEGIYNPTADALKEFAVSVADSTPKIIAAVILLVIGLVVGKIVSKVTAKAVKNILQKTGQKNEDLKIGEEINSKFDSVKLISSTTYNCIDQSLVLGSKPSCICINYCNWIHCCKLCC